MSGNTAVTLIGSNADGIVVVIGINNSGQVLEGTSDALLWQNGVTTLVANGEGLAFNNNGEVAGQTPAGQAAIFQGGSASVLPVSPAGLSGYAQALNDSGVAAGILFPDPNAATSEAVTWQDGQMTVLPGLGGSLNTARAINDAGEIAGISSLSSGDEHAVTWTGGKLTNLALLPGYDSSAARSINQSGEVVGYAFNINNDPPSTLQAVAWVNGQISDLSQLPGGQGASAYGVNDAGIVVGISYTGSHSSDAVAWINGGIVDLNSLISPHSGWVLEEADGINDQDQVVGTGTYNGVNAAFLLALPADAAPILTASAALQTGADWIAGTSVADSAANVVADLSGLQSLVIGGKLTSISLTDSSTPTLTLSASQLTNDAAALAAIGSGYAVSVTASNVGQTINGPEGDGMTLVFAGDAAQYTVTASDTKVTVNGEGGTYQLTNVAALQFADHTEIVAAPPGSDTVTTGNVTELYAAVLDREPDLPGLAFYQNYLNTNPNTPLLQFAEWFLSSSEYTSTHNYAQTTTGDEQFITDSYENLLNRTPSAAEIAYYEANVMTPALKGLKTGTQAYTNADFQAHAQMLVYFSASPEFLTDVQITAAHPADAQHWLVLT